MFISTLTYKINYTNPTNLVYYVHMQVRDEKFWGYVSQLYNYITLIT